MTSQLVIFRAFLVFMPPKELWEAYSNRTVRLSIRATDMDLGAFLVVWR